MCVSLWPKSSYHWCVCLYVCVCACVFLLYSFMHVASIPLRGPGRFPDPFLVLQYCCDYVRYGTLLLCGTTYLITTGGWTTLRVCASGCSPPWPEMAGAVWIGLSHTFSIIQQDLERGRPAESQSPAYKGFGQFVICLLSQVGTFVELVVFIRTYPG